MNRVACTLLAALCLGGVAHALTDIGGFKLENESELSALPTVDAISVQPKEATVRITNTTGTELTYSCDYFEAKPNVAMSLYWEEQKSGHWVVTSYPSCGLGQGARVMRPGEKFDVTIPLSWRSVPSRVYLSFSDSEGRRSFVRLAEFGKTPASTTFAP